MTPDQGPATPGTAARCEELEGALRKLLRWAEMEIDANQHTGHFLPHGYVHDQACRECVGIRARAGLLCGYHNALRVAGLKGEPQVSAPTAPTDSIPEIERLKAENASLLESLREAKEEHRLCTGKLIQAAGRIANAEHDLAAAAEKMALIDCPHQADGRTWTVACSECTAAAIRAAASAAEQRAEAAEKRSADLDGLAATMAERTFEGRCACGERVFVGNGTIESHKDRNANPCIGGRSPWREVCRLPLAPIARAALHDEERPPQWR